VEHVPVGDTKAPLLRIVNRMSDRGGENIHEAFNPPSQKRSFDTVEINLMIAPGCLFRSGPKNRSLFWNFVELPINISRCKRRSSFVIRRVNMKHRQYCCDAIRHLYEEYYSRQNGGEIPVFVGRRYQRGHGLGSILCGFCGRFGVGSVLVTLCCM